MRTLLKTLMAQFLFLILYYTSFRILFLTYNFSQFKSVSIQNLLEAFALGFRFDIAAILMTSGVFLLIWFYGYRLFKNRYFRSGLYFLFFAVHFFIIGLNISDIELIHYSGQRLTMNYFAIASDIESQAFQMAGYYWQVVVFFSIIFYLFVRYFPRLPERINFAKSTFWRDQVLVGLLLIVLIVVGVRGGFQNKPLRVAHAYRFNKNLVGHLALNSTFTFIRSGKGHKQETLNLMPEGQTVELLKRNHSRNFRGVWSQPQNVIVIIVESLATEYMGRPNGGDGYTPFLDSLSEKGLLVSNFYANGRRSIEAIPAILASIPSILPEAFLTSNYQGARVIGLGEILNQHGYSTAFFHWAENGSMFFDSFAWRAGFTDYYGLKEYPHADEDYDGFWGIFDEPYLKYVGEMASAMPKPFALGVFTLSSHQPYTIPPQYKNKLKKGPLPIHESISYSDMALRKFFEGIENKPWYKDTFFLITGDHTSKSVNPAYESEFGQYKVPLILFHPKMKWPTISDGISAQHADIVPTILDVLDIDFKSEIYGFRIGTSIFSRLEDHFVVNRTPLGFWYLAGDHYIKVDERLNLLESNLPEGDEFARHMNRLKAYLQYTINGLVKGRFFDPASESVKL